MLSNLIVTALLMVGSPAVEGPFQDLTFEAALAAAKKDGKVVMIDFFTTWCGPCKRLDKTTWADADVQRWLAEKTVPLKMDAEKEAELARRFGVEAYPTMVFVKSDGTKIDAIRGFKDPAEFLALAKDALDGRTSAVRTRENLERLKAGLVGHEQDAQARSKYADELANAGHLDEALAEYLWCFDEGMKTPTWTGVRISFLLGSIAELGKKHPPAIQALRERRDAAEARFDSGSGSEQDAVDAVSISRALQQQDRILALYEKAREAKSLSPRIRMTLADEVLGPLVERHRYGEALELFDDPRGYVRGSIQMFRSTPKTDFPDDEQFRKAMADAMKEIQGGVVTDCARVYEAALGVAKPELASVIADDLISFAPSASTYSTLISCAVRAEDSAAARLLVDRGLASVPAAERAEITRIAKSIPASK